MLTSMLLTYITGVRGSSSVMDTLQTPASQQTPAPAKK
jgi:hypothetical protein